MGKKVLSVIVGLIVTCMPLTVINASAVEIPALTATIDTGESVTIKDTDGDGYYEIGTADELYAFAAIVNDGNFWLNAILTKDIVINNGTISGETANARVWTPIANPPIYYCGYEFEEDEEIVKEEDYFYQGSFNGNGKSISGLYFFDELARYVALFRSLGENGEIKNLKITNSYIYGLNTVAGIVAENRYGTISNCVNECKIKTWSEGGGIVGYNKSGTVIDCVNNGSIESVTGCGGIASGNSCQSNMINCVNNGKLSGSWSVGGIVSCNFYSNIINCVNKGQVSPCYLSGWEYMYGEGEKDYQSYSGGIAGKTEGGTISQCSNFARVEGKSVYMGGIVGSSETSVINDCINTGYINKGHLIGGIVSNGYNTTIKNCCNAVEIQNGSSSIIRKWSNDLTVENCYYYDDDKGTCSKLEYNKINGATSKTADQIASGEVAYLLQGERDELVWGQTVVSDKYPVVGGENVYYGYAKCSDKEKSYSNTKTSPKGHLYDENEICVYCGIKDPSSASICYEISNAEQLLAFAEIVNSSEIMHQRAVLTNDIDMSGVKWEGIATSETVSFTGSFDGQGHSIKNLNQNTGSGNGERLALFISIGEGGEVKNLVLDGANVWSANQYNKKSSAALTFHNKGKITNCVVKNSSIQQGAYSYLGGIAGRNDKNGVIENCAVINTHFTRRWGGASSGSMGGIVQTNKGTVNNCYTYGCSFNNGAESKSAVVAFGNAPQNCYYYTESTVATGNSNAMSKEQFASGEVSYYLGSIWGQTIGTDEYPVIGGENVYLVIDSDKNITYSNTNPYN